MKWASSFPTLEPPISPMPILCILFFSFLVGESLGMDDPHFLACSVPKSCRDGQNITFPFYIQGKQEPYCGHPAFQLFCNSNGQPTLNISDNYYTVHKIFYQNLTLRVSNAAFFNSDPDCIPQIKNTPFPSPIFELVPGQTYLRLLYNCSNSSLLHGLPRVDNRCYGDKTDLVVVSPEKNRDLGEASEECTTEVVAPVEAYGGTTGRVLDHGFWLKWKAHNCSICKESGGACGFNNVTYDSQCFCPDGTHWERCDSVPNKKLPKILLGTLPAGVGLLLLAICCFKKKFLFENIIYFWKRKNFTHQNVQAFLKNQGHLTIKQYNYSDIKKITNSFKDILGEGGYGNVYKGKLQDGSLVAVKVLKESKGNGEEFINEVASISRTSHVNIVSLMGFCFEHYKRALIYEFMPNGSLEKFIYRTKPSKDVHQMEWEVVYKIAIGIAQGLEYLHKGCNTQILHFDIKPHNILLGEYFCPKISDFGLAKICHRE